MKDTVWLRVDTGMHYSAIRNRYLAQQGYEPINTVGNTLAVRDRESTGTLLMLQYPGCSVTVYDSLLDLMSEYRTEHPKRIVKMA